MDKITYKTDRQSVIITLAPAFIGRERELLTRRKRFFRRDNGNRMICVF